MIDTNAISIYNKHLISLNAQKDHLSTSNTTQRCTKLWAEKAPFAIGLYNSLTTFTEAELKASDTIKIDIDADIVKVVKLLKLELGAEI